MDKSYIQKLVSLSLLEDIGDGDITTDTLVPKGHFSKAHIILKSDGIICGLQIALQVFKTLDPKVNFKPLVKEGQSCKSGTVIASVQGNTRALLTGERVTLNFIAYLSAIATKTRDYVNAVKGYKTMILDTRKTTPLLRVIERYAVRTGGGANHRFDLSEMAMVKDNHRVVAAGYMGMDKTVLAIKTKSKKLVELEVDTLTQFKEALGTKSDVILLDNMAPSQVRQAVSLRNASGSKIKLEASGGIHLKNVRTYAAAGVDRISVGSLTHSRQALDISMELI